MLKKLTIFLFIILSFNFVFSQQSKKEGSSSHKGWTRTYLEGGGSYKQDGSFQKIANTVGLILADGIALQASTVQKAYNYVSDKVESYQNKKELQFGGGSFGGGGASDSFEMPGDNPIKSDKVEKTNKLTALAGCVWDMQIPPRIISGPGCLTGGSRLCRGKVICGGEVRIAICSEYFCKENTATECRNQQGYSKKSLN